MFTGVITSGKWKLTDWRPSHVTHERNSASTLANTSAWPLSKTKQKSQQPAVTWHFTADDHFCPVAQKESICSPVVVHACFIFYFGNTTTLWKMLNSTSKSTHHIWILSFSGNEEHSTILRIWTTEILLCWEGFHHISVTVLCSYVDPVLTHSVFSWEENTGGAIAASKVKTLN